MKFSYKFPQYGIIGRPVTHTAPNGTQALDRALDLMFEIARADGRSLRLSDLAERTGLTVATTHRLLGALIRRGLVDQLPGTKRLVLGLRLFSLAAQAGEAAGLAQAARPAVLRVAAGTGDCVFLMARSGFDAVCLDRLDGDYTIRTLTGGIGGSTPLGFGTGSLVILAHLPDAERTEVLTHNAPRIHRLGAIPPTLAVLDHIRRDGFVHDPGQPIAGVAGIAIPIRTQRGVPVAAFGIGGTEARISKERLPEILTMLRLEVTGIEDALARQRTLLPTM